MKNLTKNYKQAHQLNDEADELIEDLLGVSVPNKSFQDKKINSGHETYQLPVQTGIEGKALNEGDKPWIVGGFSPNAPTDARHAFHNGVDLKAFKGTPIYPIASGVVKAVGMGQKSGNYVACLHENGQVQSFYAHMDSINVQQGQEITQKTILGRVGTTGNAQGTGGFKGGKELGHCHVEVKINGALTSILSVVGKQVGSLSKRAKLFSQLEKLSQQFDLLVKSDF